MYRTIYFLSKGQETGFLTHIQDGGKDDSVVLKYEPVQYSTLKNEPQVHFSTGSFFNVTPAARLRNKVQPNTVMKLLWDFAYVPKGEYR